MERVRLIDTNGSEEVDFSYKPQFTLFSRCRFCGLSSPDKKCPRCLNSKSNTRNFRS